MGVVGALALLAKITSVLILMRWRDGDENVRSVWLCSGNDAIGNLAVMAAALMVARLNSGWPDLIVAMFMASRFLNASAQILRKARNETRTTSHPHP